MPDLIVKHIVTEAFRDAVVAFEVREDTLTAVLSYVCKQCAGYGDNRGCSCDRCGGDGRQKESFSNMATFRERIGEDEYARVRNLLSVKL